MNYFYLPSLGYDLLRTHTSVIMIIKVFLLFLLGTAGASNLFMKKLRSPNEATAVPSYKSGGCPTAADWAPLICKFLQTNKDLYYKPQLIAPSTYIPPLAVHKCENSEIKVNLELPAPVEEKKPILIPRPPELPPLTIPKFPVPVIVGLPEKINEHSDNPEMSLIHIPAAPQLSVLDIPIIPQIVEQPGPDFFNEAIPEIDNNGIDEKPMVIPQPPELPEFTMPEIPEHVEIPSRPVPPVMDIAEPPMEPPMIAEKPAKEPYLNEKVITPEIDYNLANFEPISIPQPPQLPAFVMPELPAYHFYFEDKPIENSPIQADFEPLATIPAAPELPRAKLPEFPVLNGNPSESVLPPKDFFPPIVVVEQLNEEPCLKEETPKFGFEHEHIIVPQAPELPAFVMPELPLNFEHEPIKTYYEPLAPLLAAPELPRANVPEFPVNVETASSPALPPLDIPSTPTFEEEPLPEIGYNMIKAPFSVPAPPELPASVMPELPLNFEHELIKYVPHAPLPAEAGLPEATLPEIPIYVEIPSAPALPATDIPSPPKFEEQPLPENDYNMNRAPILIPAPPELSTFIMPELPTLSFEHEPMKTYYEQLASLPAALELPEAKLPEFPINIEIASPKFDEQSLPEVNNNMNNRDTVSIPAPPELPLFEMPELLVKVHPNVALTPELPSVPKWSESKSSIVPNFINKPCESSDKLKVELAAIPNPYFERYFNEKVKESHSIMIPTKPNHEFIHSPCVYNLVMHHVLPNIESDNFRSLEKIKALPPTLLPCSY